jgi:hypothetical protein
MDCADADRKQTAKADMSFRARDSCFRTAARLLTLKIRMSKSTDASSWTPDKVRKFVADNDF